MLHAQQARDNRLCRRLALKKKRLQAARACNDVTSLHRAKHHLRSFNFTYRFCGAMFWGDERVKKNSRLDNPIFSLCCQGGKVNLPLLAETPIPLRHLMDYNGGTEPRKFGENIRAYNSMFAFTSFGANVDRDINKKPGPYVFRINGQTHHLMGSLLPIDGEKPRFAQLYIYDIENEVDNRLQAFNKGDDSVGLERRVVTSLLAMFDDVNQIVKSFRMLRDRYKDSQCGSFKLKILGKRPRDSMQYGTPVYPEIAGLVVGDLGVIDARRDIIVEHKTNGLKCISDLHPSFMPMQYPILFPFGEDGYSIDIPYDHT